MNHYTSTFTRRKILIPSDLQRVKQSQHYFYKVYALSPDLFLSSSLHLPIWSMYNLVAHLAKTDHFGLKIRIIWAHCDEFLITSNPFKTSPNLEHV